MTFVNSLPPPTSTDEHDLAKPSFAMLAEMLSMGNRASGSALLSMMDVAIGFSNPFLDKYVYNSPPTRVWPSSFSLFFRLLPHLLYTRLLTPSRITGLVKIGKNTLFPNGYPGPPPIVPSLEEQIILRRNLELRLSELVPCTSLSPPPNHSSFFFFTHAHFTASISPFIVGPTPQARRNSISGVLDPLSSSECNAHLVMALFDLVLLALFPDMAAQPESGGGGEEGSLDGTGSISTGGMDLEVLQ